MWTYNPKYKSYDKLMVKFPNKNIYNKNNKQIQSD